MIESALISTTVFGTVIELRTFGLVAVCLACLTYPIYIKAMVDGKHKPPRSSWFLWLVLDLIAFSSNYAAGTFDAMLAIYSVGTFFVSAFTLKYGKEGWTRTETNCTVIVGIAIAVWLVIGPSAALICSLIGITVAMYPLLSGVLAGEYEEITAWTLVLFGSFFNLLDGQVLVSVWFMVLQALVVGAVYYHHFYRKNKAFAVVVEEK